MSRTGGDVPRRSIDIGRGKRTSVSVEDEFWEEFCLIAQSKQISVGALVVEVKRQHEPVGNLSRAIRTYVLQQVKTRAAQNVHRV